MTLYRCQGTTTTAKRTNCMPHNATLTCSLYNHTTRKNPQTRGGRAHHTPLPLGKLHRHVVPGMQYDACVVPGISWSLGKRVSFYRFIVSLSFYRFRNRYTEIVSVRYFLSYRFQTITPKFGTISTTNVHILHFFDSIPTIFLVHFSGCPCIASVLLNSHHPHTNGSS